MIKNIKKIVVVGGGSAGWMSAAALAKQFPNKEIIVIESPDHPTVGVGESTLGSINAFLQFLEIKDRDFMRECNASYKLSIKFTDFYEKDAGSFHYPFGYAYTADSRFGLSDWYIRKAIDPSIPSNDFSESFYPASILSEKNKISYNDPVFQGFDFDRDVAYHFDAALFGKWLRDKYCIPRGITYVPDTIENVEVDENGIKCLHMKSTGTIVGDLYIDCTGFKSMLLGEALQEPFESWTDRLPNNSAWAIQLPYKDKRKELEPYTNCTAINNGWVWNIPSWDRLGTGYVFSDKYISPEDAREEFKQYLMSDKMTVPRTAEEIEDLNYKLIRMRVGIHSRTFVKNVCAIGLSAGFVEPLESNGLYTVHEFLFHLLRTLERDAVSQYNKDAYNYITKNMWYRLATFVGQHYSLSIRDDTAYWKDISNRDFGFDSKEIDAHRQLANAKYYGINTIDDESGIVWIAGGMNYFILDKITIDYKEFYNYTNLKKIMRPYFQAMDRNKRNWRTIADTKPDLIDFLKSEIYNQE